MGPKTGRVHQDGPNEFRSSALKGIGLGGLTASDGVGWVNVLDGPPQSGHGSTSHGAMHLKDR